MCNNKKKPLHKIYKINNRTEQNGGDVIIDSSVVVMKNALDAKALCDSFYAFIDFLPLLLIMCLCFLYAYRDYACDSDLKAIQAHRTRSLGNI